MLPTPAASGRKPPLPPPHTVAINMNNSSSIINMNNPLKARVPMKHKRRLRRHLVIFATILLALTYLLRALRHNNNTNNDILVSDSERYKATDEQGKVLDVGATIDIRPRRPLEELGEIPRNVVYLTKEAVQFCYIPKNACSALKPLLRRREGFLDWEDARMIHGKKNGLRKLIWLEDKAAAMRQLGDSAKVYRFVTIRDPWARLVSAWQNKIYAPWPDQRADFWRHLAEECPRLWSTLVDMPPEGQPLMSMKTFLRCLNEEGGISNEHWRPQSQLCGLDHIKYNRYIRMEQLREGVLQVAHELGWDASPEDRLVLEKKLHLDRLPVYEKSVAQFFPDQESIQLARNYYRTDLELLGYPLSPTGKIGFFSVFNGTNFHPEFNHILAPNSDNNNNNNEIIINNNKNKNSNT